MTGPRSAASARSVFISLGQPRSLTYFSMLSGQGDGGGDDAGGGRRRRRWCRRYPVRCRLETLPSLETLAKVRPLGEGGRFVDPAERRRQAIEDSKYLGGDMEHTHLVKGLDYALLQKVCDIVFFFEGL